MDDGLVIFQFVVIDLNECACLLLQFFVVKKQLLEEVVVLLDDDFSLTSHCRSTTFENHLISDRECPLVLGKHSARWLLLNLFQNRLYVRDSPRLLHRRSDKALELIAVHNGFNLGELKIELLNEVSSFDDESYIFVA